MMKWWWCLFDPFWFFFVCTVLFSRTQVEKWRNNIYEIKIKHGLVHLVLSPYVFFLLFVHVWIEFESDSPWNPLRQNYSKAKVYIIIRRQTQTLIYMHPPNWKQLINNLFVTWNELFKLHVHPIPNHHKAVSNDHRRRINCDWLNFVFTKCLHLLSLKRYLESISLYIYWVLSHTELDQLKY